MCLKRTTPNHTINNHPRNGRYPTPNFHPKSTTPAGKFACTGKELQTLTTTTIEIIDRLHQHSTIHNEAPLVPKQPPFPYFIHSPLQSNPLAALSFRHSYLPALSPPIPLERPQNLIQIEHMRRNTCPSIGITILLGRFCHCVCALYFHGVDDKLGAIKTPSQRFKQTSDATSKRDASSQTKFTTTMNAYIYSLRDNYRARRRLRSPMPPFPNQKEEEEEECDDDYEEQEATKTTRLFAHFIIDPTHTTKASTDNMYYYSNPS